MFCSDEQLRSSSLLSCAGFLPWCLDYSEVGGLHFGEWAGGLNFPVPPRLGFHCGFSKLLRPAIFCRACDLRNNCFSMLPKSWKLDFAAREHDRFEPGPAERAGRSAFRPGVACRVLSFRRDVGFVLSLLRSATGPPSWFEGVLNLEANFVSSDHHSGLFECYAEESHSGGGAA